MGCANSIPVTQFPELQVKSSLCTPQGHRWLTSDFVLFDGLIATPTGSRVADPLHVLVGDEALSSRLVRRTPEELPEHGQQITIHEIEKLYGQLKLAVRAHRARVASSSRTDAGRGAR